jgi:hypothetical protein
MEMGELVRIFAIQESPRLMFLLGAGVSAQAGIPTANDLVWIFKREIYCAETGASKEALRDLSVEGTRRRLQDHFDTRHGFPPRADDREYSFYFGKCYQHPQDRRAFIRRLVQQGKVTIGHECLAVLLGAGRLDWAWTPNFDDLVERAERGNAPRRLCHVGPESSTRMERIIDEDLRPVLVKLHGDYRYDALQNTDEETRALDASLRRHLVDLSSNRGLIVVGYSGRDESILSALEEVANSGLSQGLYWCIRELSQVRTSVRSLVENLLRRTGRGGFVEIPSFDELLFRLYRQCSLSDREIEAKAEVLFEQRRRFRLSIATTLRNPIKSNGIKIVAYPTSPYRFQTSIQNWDELRGVVGTNPIVAGLWKGYVLAFGNRERLRSVFRERVLSSLEVSDIRPSDLLRPEGVTLGLFYDIIGSSLIQTFKLLRLSRRTYYLPDPALQGQSREYSFQHQGRDFRIQLVTEFQGLRVNEGFACQLTFHEDTLWFVLEPRAVPTVDGSAVAPVESRKVVTNLVMSRIYNAQMHEKLLFWIYYLASIHQPIVFTLRDGDEVVAQIELDQHYAYSSITRAHS